MWIAGLQPFFWPDRREVLPSMAITLSGAAVSAATQGDEAFLELLGVEDRHDVAEMVVCWRTVLERTEAAQKLAFLAAEQGDIDEGLGPGQHGEQAEKQDLVERVGYLNLAGEGPSGLEIAQKNDRLVKCGTNPSARLPWLPPPVSESRVAMDSALYRFVTYSFTRLPHER